MFSREGMFMKKPKVFTSALVAFSAAMAAQGGAFAQDAGCEPKTEMEDTAPREHGLVSYMENGLSSHLKSFIGGVIQDALSKPAHYCGPGDELKEECMPHSHDAELKKAEQAERDAKPAKEEKPSGKVQCDRPFLGA